MNSDIRVEISFKNHRKRLKLRKLLGDNSTDYLLDLWLTASVERPEGELTGLDETDIALMAGWSNDPLTFVEALVNARWLDRGDDGIYRLHNWKKRNGYACGSVDRSDRSRFSRMAKTHPALYKKLKDQGYTGISTEEYASLTTVQRPLTSGSSPLPSPLPSPAIKEEPPPDIPYDAIMAAYNKFCPSLPKTIHMNELRRSAIKAAYLKYAKHDGGPLRVFDALFKKAEGSKFLTGKERGHDGKVFKADFDWLLKDEKMVLTLEGKYDDAPEAPARVRELAI